MDRRQALLDQARQRAAEKQGSAPVIDSSTAARIQRLEEQVRELSEQTASHSEKIEKHEKAINDTDERMDAMWAAMTAAKAHSKKKGFFSRS